MGVEIEVTKALENGDTLHLRPGEREREGGPGGDRRTYERGNVVQKRILFKLGSWIG